MFDLSKTRTRIRSVKNTQKITRAMYLVSASRLRKAQQATVKLRPYAAMAVDMLSPLIGRSGEDEIVHPMLVARDTRAVLLIVLTSNRGLAGGFNNNLCRVAYEIHEQRVAEGKRVAVLALGRRGASFFAHRGALVDTSFATVLDDATYAAAGSVARAVGGRFVRREVDAVHLAYNEFRSAISQAPTVEQLLPIVPHRDDAEAAARYAYEPSREHLLNGLLPLALHLQVYRAFLESLASEHAARMVAMDTATTNAESLIEALTLHVNRQTQAAITTEIMEIVGGAEALKR